MHGSVWARACAYAPACVVTCKGVGGATGSARPTGPARTGRAAGSDGPHGSRRSTWPGLYSCLSLCLSASLPLCPADCLALRLSIVVSPLCLYTPCSSLSVSLLPTHEHTHTRPSGASPPHSAPPRPRTTHPPPTHPWLRRTVARVTRTTHTKSAYRPTHTLSSILSDRPTHQQSSTNLPSSRSHARAHAPCAASPRSLCLGDLVRGRRMCV